VLAQHALPPARAPRVPPRRDGGGLAGGAALSVTIPAAQAEAAALLARLTGAAAPVETHISAVFVGRDEAFKLKKAVALGFLDFTSLAARERFCRRELE